MKRRIYFSFISILLFVLLTACTKNSDSSFNGLRDVRNTENGERKQSDEGTISQGKDEIEAQEEYLISFTWIGEDALIIDVKDELLEECLLQRDYIILIDADEENENVLGQIDFISEDEYLGDKRDCRISRVLPNSEVLFEAFSLKSETVCKDGRHKFLIRTGHMNVNDESGYKYSGGEWDNILPDNATRHSIGKCSGGNTGKEDSFKNIFSDNEELLDEFDILDLPAEDERKSKDYLNEIFTEKDLEYFGEIGDYYAVFSTTIPKVIRYKYRTSPFYNLDGVYIYDMYELDDSYGISVDAQWIVTFSESGGQEKSYLKLTFPTDMDAVSVDPKICGTADGEDLSDPMHVSSAAAFDTYGFHEAVTRMNYNYSESEVIFDGNVVYFMGDYGADNGLMYVGVWTLYADEQLLLINDLFRESLNNANGIINAQAECLITKTYDYNGVTQISEDFKYEDIEIKYLIHK